ncbi:hypothetical protein A3G53_03615 [Candidatus Nomurabacteria bacterium RIFCSPLOWO2_12_FULL_44_11]|uniref:DUF2878 domain-containing protein n=1 Tax=Candidatus Nomurabacteria bacterium RIFCSPLOWO2_12_FULL_44_11 TaxID=1801796 RepID=A0A1F6Y492_9BACT|nr:MAG: hypothetical protein A3G53_03615 [Candidatus Nomurabacteria bacterium RIFCSPLOWO2_12_FULL_44_11]
MQKAWKIFLNSIPVLVMIGLIPIVDNDYILAILYLGITIFSLFIHKAKNDILVFVFGFIVMIISESIFISTGVETFIRNSLFGLMPLWLPFLWGYGFIVIKRSVQILD